MRLVTDIVVNLFNYADRGDNAFVVAARAVKDDRIAASEVAVNRSADIHLANGVPMRLLLNKVSRRVGPQDRVR